MLPTRLLRAARGPKPNITGFDIRALRNAAANPPRYDPWERAEAWRYTGIFTRRSMYRDALPGLGIASVAFATYCAYEHFFLKDDGHHDAAEDHH